MASTVTSLLQSTPNHIHLDNEVCPWCEQPIPHEKFAEISARVAEEQQAKLDEHEAALQEQFDHERQQLAAKAQTVLEAAQRATEDAVAKARLETEDKYAEDKQAAEVARQNMEVAFATRTAESETKYTIDLAAAVATAELGVTEKLKATIEEAATKLASAEAAKADAERIAQEKVTRIEQEHVALKQQFEMATAAHNAEIVVRTNEVRETLGKENSKALLAEQAKAFAEKQKLTETVDDLKRQIEKRTASELGEGSEIDLFEVLEEAFEGDNIRRVPKGEPGADVVHEIVENGVVCGTIVYDSKNRNAWQSNFAVKLRSDMIAAKADYAILSTNKFPAGAKQLELLNGVILACPARVVVLAQLLRTHIIQMHARSMSEEQRKEKTAALYHYITSERCSQLMDSLQTSFGKLEAIDVDEQQAHQSVWTKRGRILKEVEKMRGTFVNDLSRIIGATETVE